MKILIALVLLGTIAIAEITRLALTHLPTSRRSHFKQKLLGTTKMIWDLEFKLFKTRELREQIRVEYDFMQSRVVALDKTIAEWPKDGDKAELAKATDSKVIAERDRDRLQNQIAALDIEISGAPASAEMPEGHIGIVQQIDSYRELTGMLRDYIKSI